MGEPKALGVLGGYGSFTNSGRELPVISSSLAEGFDVASVFHFYYPHLPLVFFWMDGTKLSRFKPRRKIMEVRVPQRRGVGLKGGESENEAQ